MFLVRTNFVPPENLPESEIDRLRAAEREQAELLQSEGVISHLWRQTGTSCAWGVWNLSTRAELEQALRSLPLRGYMTVDIHPVEIHPNALTRTAPHLRGEQ